MASSVSRNQLLSFGLIGLAIVVIAAVAAWGILRTNSATAENQGAPAHQSVAQDIQTGPASAVPAQNVSTKQSSSTDAKATSPTGEPIAAQPTSPPAIPGLSDEPSPLAEALEAVTGPVEPPPTGLTQPIDTTKHPQATSTYESLVAGTHPERATPLIIPAPFDRAAYEKDPTEYLSVSEPGRVWQAAQPGTGVPRITAFGPTRHAILSGESVALMVRAEPNMPISFTSFDLGTFAENGLPNITVAADERGYARAIWEATPGVIADARILCASPTASGQLSFIVTVAPAP